MINLVAASSNDVSTHPDDALQNDCSMERFRTSIPYLYDESQQIARQSKQNVPQNFTFLIRLVNL